MLSDTLTEGLGRYRIGPKLRRLRLKKSMGLVQVGAQTGLSTAMLSKIERGQLFPTLPTLLRIAMVFGVGLEHFFVVDSDQPLLHVVRKSERVRFAEPQGAETPAYIFESLDFPLPNRKNETYLAEFPADAPVSHPHHHPGIELVYVIAGTLKITFEDTFVVLKSGDAVTFDGAAPHSYTREGRGAASALVSVSTA